MVVGVGGAGQHTVEVGDLVGSAAVGAGADEGAVRAGRGADGHAGEAGDVVGTPAVGGDRRVMSEVADTL